MRVRRRGVPNGGGRLPIRVDPGVEQPRAVKRAFESLDITGARRFPPGAEAVAMPARLSTSTGAPASLAAFSTAARLQRFARPPTFDRRIDFAGGLGAEEARRDNVAR